MYRTNELPNWVTHEEGEVVQVTEGHLFVRRPESGGRHGKALAVYAPNAWREAKVVKQDQS